MQDNALTTMLRFGKIFEREKKTNLKIYVYFKKSSDGPLDSVKIKQTKQEVPVKS